MCQTCLKEHLILLPRPPKRSTHAASTSQRISSRPLPCKYATHLPTHKNNSSSGLRPYPGWSCECYFFIRIPRGWTPKTEKDRTAIPKPTMPLCEYCEPEYLRLGSRHRKRFRPASEHEKSHTHTYDLRPRKKSKRDGPFAAAPLTPSVTMHGADPEITPTPSSSTVHRKESPLRAQAKRAVAMRRRKLSYDDARAATKHDRFSPEMDYCYTGSSLSIIASPASSCGFSSLPSSMDSTQLHAPIPPTPQLQTPTSTPTPTLTQTPTPTPTPTPVPAMPRANAGYSSNPKACQPRR